jgi:hypothetical protein
MAFPNYETNSVDTGTGSVDLPIPSGTTEGDLLVAIVIGVNHSTSTEEIAPPTGWTFDSSSHVHGSIYMGVLWKVAGASETTTNFGFPTLSISMRGWMHRITGGTYGRAVYAEATSSGADVVDFPATTANGDALVLRAARLATSATSFDTPPAGTEVIANNADGLWITTATEGAVTADTLVYTENKRNVGATIIIEAVSSGLTIDSTDAFMQRNTDFQVVCSNPSTTPTTGNTTLTNGNDTLTPSSVTGSDPYTLTFPVGDLTKQVDAVGYDWTLEITPDEP